MGAPSDRAKAKASAARWVSAAVAFIASPASHGEDVPKPGIETLPHEWFGINGGKKRGHQKGTTKKGATKGGTKRGKQDGATDGGNKRWQQKEETRGSNKKSFPPSLSRLAGRIAFADTDMLTTASRTRGAACQPP